MIVVFDGLLVGVEDVISSRPGGDQHNQGGTGKVKVGDQTKIEFEMVSRVDENIGGTGNGFYSSCLIGRALQRPNRGGAYQP